MDDNKAKALAAALAQIEKQFGKGSIMKMGEGSVEKDLQVVSTGSLGLDIALGVGGLPRGRVVEIYGPESSGKTTLTLQVVAEMQKMGGTAAFIDAAPRVAEPAERVGAHDGVEARVRERQPLAVGHGEVDDAPMPRGPVPRAVEHAVAELDRGDPGIGAVVGQVQPGPDGDLQHRSPRPPRRPLAAGRQKPSLDGRDHRVEPRGLVVPVPTHAFLAHRPSIAEPRPCLTGRNRRRRLWDRCSRGDPSSGP